jgi:hypothetical protein
MKFLIAGLVLCLVFSLGLVPNVNAYYGSYYGGYGSSLYGGYGSSLYGGYYGSSLYGGGYGLYGSSLYGGLYGGYGGLYGSSLLGGLYGGYGGLYGSSLLGGLYGGYGGLLGGLYGGYSSFSSPFGAQNLYYPVETTGGLTYQVPFMQIAPLLGVASLYNNLFPNLFNPQPQLPPIVNVSTPSNIGVTFPTPVNVLTLT